MKKEVQIQDPYALLLISSIKTSEELLREKARVIELLSNELNSEKQKLFIYINKSMGIDNSKTRMSINSDKKVVHLEDIEEKQDE